MHSSRGAKVGQPHLPDALHNASRDTCNNSIMNKYIVVNSVEIFAKIKLSVFRLHERTLGYPMIVAEYERVHESGLIPTISTTQEKT